MWGKHPGQVSVGVGLEGHCYRAYPTRIGPQLLSDARQRESRGCMCRLRPALLVLAPLHDTDAEFQVTSSSALVCSGPRGTDLRLWPLQVAQLNRVMPTTAQFVMLPITAALPALIAIKPITMESFDTCVTHRYSSLSHCSTLVVAKHPLTEA